MTPPARRPRLAVIVGNGITGDSRVQKTAISAARAGWEVLLIGAGRGRAVKSTMGAVQVVRVGVAAHMRAKQKGHKLRRIVTQFGIADKEALARTRAANQTWVRQTTARIGRMRSTEGRSAAANAIVVPASRALGALVRARRLTHKLRVRAFQWEQRYQAAPTGQWAKDWPYLLDLDLAFGPAIEEFKPDVIHANDITMIGTAAQSVARMRNRGEKVRWLYDAHEYVRGVDWPDPLQASAFNALEKEFIGFADAVVTVSPEIAELLRKDYKLKKTPLVVRNVPIRETVNTGRETYSVRRACGLEPDVPLLVYSGWLAAERGLGVAVDALPELPEFHLAIVSGRTSPDLTMLLEKADKLAVRDRIHVVPYVPQHAVPDYLSSADLGLICSKRTLNYEISLPTKLAEYLHGGLPVVVSDVKTLSAYVRKHRVGEVFRSDDAASFVATVTHAMANRKQLADAITEEILTDLSWETQSAGLMRLYSEISGITPPNPRPEVRWSLTEQPVPVAGPATEPGPLPRWRPLDNTRVRLGLGPANYAGQLATFAQAICRSNPEVSAEVVMVKTSPTLLYPADVYVDQARLPDLDCQLEQVQRAIGRYTHLVADAFLPFFGHLNGNNIEGDLPALQRAKIKVALLGHGSEVRHPRRHLARHEYSLFRDAPDGYVERYTARAERNRKVAEETGLPLFVTTPDLLDDLPWATWAPLVVDLDAWATDQPVMERPRPVVLHGPSKRWTKGTDRILPVLNDLHERGAIELKLAENVAWKDMTELVKTSDIVIDQFTTGSYGTFAVEAMAAGKPVVAYLSDSVAATVGSTPPIVNATPANLRQVLESLLDDRAGTARRGAESVAYVREYHDGRRTAAAFASFLAS
ncbi:glycosyl transferase family 1 [Plantactinospora sp. BC1]|uniref:glycosyltransferase family 4 protein n=1 Tax=Plantactinospora sp. BC1 TaxID=2108470 RepID=UPI000D150BA2|nr:glycosyltransferase [Plantactinospora sp. BC1]AVT32829.1 glycosyl transferase family 1 [Plantactinospora sp. BC1]